MKFFYEKKKYFFIISVISFVFFSCSLNNQEGSVENIPHTHTFSTSWTTDETYHWHAATCEHSTEIAEKNKHIYGDWIDVADSTEDEEGSKERVCSVCGDKIIKKLPLLNHIHILGTEHLATESTCITKGSIRYYDCAKSTCTTKLDSSLNELESVQIDLNPENHVGTETSWTINETRHKETYKCCGGVKIDSSAHEGSYISNKNATYETDGTKYRNCSVCGYYENIIDEGSKLNFKRIDDNFVKVRGVTITGTEEWTPTSNVFVSGRAISLPDLIVCDHEVTIGEYKLVMKNFPRFKALEAYDEDGNLLSEEESINYPVGVFWFETLFYCNKRSMSEGFTPCYKIKDTTDPDEWPNIKNESNWKYWDEVICDFEANGYRLPTEAEWEWLARGEQNYRFPGSDTWNDVGWFGTSPREVKTKLPNAYDLYNMAGNVDEWCWDKYIITITADTPPYGPTDGELTNGFSSRVRRDGYDISNHKHGQLNHPYTTNDRNFGFRVVRTCTD